MTIKSERVAELIMAHISRMLLTELRDPRVSGITITEVVLDREIEHAEIYVNALGDDEREKEVLAGLKAASGFIRRELASSLKVRRVPVLHFKWDHAFKHAMYMDSVLDSLKSQQPSQPASTSINAEESDNIQPENDNDNDDN